MTDLSRAQFLARGLRGGVALVAGGSLLALASPVRAAETPPEEDLAIVRLAASAELLAQAFYSHAIGLRQFDKQQRSYLVAARANEREHYAALAKVLGDGAPVADDFQFAFPSGALESRAAAVKLGVALETAFVGAYIGAVTALQTPALRTAAGQIGASEAMHLSALSNIKSGQPIGPAFPGPLDVEQATNALAPFLGE